MIFLTMMLAQIPDDIVVRGKRTEEALAACIARDCSTPDDTRLSIAHAETQFARGRYMDARSTLAAALRRQKRNAATFPRSVAALYEARSTVELHRGDMDAYRTSVIGQTRTLRAHLPKDDPQVLLTAIQLGDFWAKNGKPRDARRQYEAAAKGYRLSGEGKLAALTTLRVAAVDLQLRNRDAATERLKHVDGTPFADDPSVRQLRAVIAARIALSRGDETGVDRLLAALRTDPANPPVLVKEGLVSGDVGTRVRNNVFGPIAMVPGDSRPLGFVFWADIGFTVAPDGSVSDAEILRGSRARGWTKAYLKALGERRYAPLNLPAGHPGLYRVERYSWRSSYTYPPGARVARLTGGADVEIVDITRSEAPVPATT